MSQDYNNTLNLPKTDFPMRAGLPVREPQALKKWQNDKTYDKLMEKNDGKPLYVLHDGPPYANGKIHMGTALNKILKDFIVRYKNMTGFKSPYVPGYDTHGLPTELKARKAAGVKSAEAMSPLSLRKLCREFALKFVDDQRDQFERLGVLGEWDNPYLTLKNEFVANQVRVFGEMAEKGYIYKGLKPVYWCPECQTALAEAEIEYNEDPCHSIYVKFRVSDDKGILKEKGIDPDNTYFVIWTTTTWTLPGNLAICLGPNYEYQVVRAGDENYIMATELTDAAMKAAKIDSYETLCTFKGAELEYMKAHHPFLDRESLIIVGDHVTLESGTGCVHTAPGFGVDDFEVCRKYDEIPMVVPVDHKGILHDAGQFDGMTTDEANKAIALHLDETGALFALQKIIHQYPHCWRCKSPIIYRATEQWFCSIKAFAETALDEIDKVRWVPEWGKTRITNMVRDRSDWCISRQRIWGVPIPILYCEDCGKEVINSETIGIISDIFEKEGADAWYSRDAKDFLPAGFKCSCGCGNFKKESDIMDVWFDSGCTHKAVLQSRDYLKYPADVYLEGADQYRGWFQSSLLTSVATNGIAPYKTVVTHGWVVDGSGKKMSKSLGNTIIPDDIVPKFGADILRLWVASSDYHADIRISDEILKQLSEGYRKIRNTARFILGNLGDFNPNTDMVDFSQLAEIDRYALMLLNRLIKTVNKGFDDFEYHTIYHAVHNFCILDMSNFYLDILKDRLYVEKADSVSRRAAQTTIYIILRALTLMISPILAFTGDEIWQFMPHLDGDDTENVVFNDIPTAPVIEDDEALIAKWSRIEQLRTDVQKALELARAEKVIGASLEASITVFAEGEDYQLLADNRSELCSVFIVSEVAVENGKGGDYQGEQVGVSVRHAAGEKCERCWSFSNTVGADSEHPTLCSRCAEILK
ncbi:MAG: isoleucine--tRNA ligase [Acutalibacteraceae bacterium]